MSDPAPVVTKVFSARDDTWEIEFSDGTVLHCAKAPHRNESRADSMIEHHAENYDDPDHTDRMRAMIAAVREHEATA